MNTETLIPQASPSPVSEVDFRKLIDNCIYGLASFPGADEIAMETSIMQTKNFYSNGQLLAVMINSLLMNCFQFKKDGAESKVKIAVMYDDYKAIINISDNGKGIKETEVGKIFDLTQQQAGTESANGLGLYIVNEIVKQLGGKTSVESAENVGTEFTIEIPNQLHLLNVLRQPSGGKKELKYFY